MAAESQITTEANNVTPPLMNTDATVCVWVGIAGPTTQTVDLTTVFGNWGAGHYYTLVADGVKVYHAFGPVAGTLDESKLGTPTQAAIPIESGEKFPFRVIAQGRAVATGSGLGAQGKATMVTYNILHFKAPTGTATGYLRLFRSSLGPNQDAGEFKGPSTGF